MRKALLLAVLGVGVLMATGNGPDFLALQIGETEKYQYQAEWAAYLAPEEDCPGGEDVAAPLAVQHQTVLCLLNWARARYGLPSLPASPVLMRAAATKARDMVRCDEFSHEPCRTTGDAAARALGHQGAFGENIAWGTGPAGAPRPTVDGWLHSPDHRANLFRREWRMQGIAVMRAGRYQGADEAAIWVSQFGG